jgi:hypothetical protein
LGCLSAILAGLAAPAFADSPPRVPDSFFGINYPSIGDESQAQRRHHLAQIAAAGLKEIRISVHWNEVEPHAPWRPDHSYDFSPRPDDWIADAAREGLRTQIAFAYAPDWNETQDALCQTFGAVSHAPNDLSAYAKATEQMVRRYGPAGTLWSEHPEIPRRPVKTWEVWNEQNLTSYWCPEPDPHRYAEMFVGAANAINAIDPTATVVVGGMTFASPSGNAKDPGEFLRAAVTHRPALANLADAVGLHAYPQGPLDQQLAVAALFRIELRQGMIPDSTPMLINEIGWTTASGAANPFTEQERIDRYNLVAQSLPRTNCNVSGMIPHAWTTREQNVNQETDFYGIAKPLTGVLYPAGQAFADSVALMLGRSANAPPTANIDTCHGMPALDRDDDGVPDEDDPAPIDPEVTEPGDDPGPPPDPADCSAALINQTLRVVSTNGAAHKAALKQYRQLRKQCVPGLKRMAKVKGKLRATDKAAKRAKLRRKHRNINARIAPCLIEMEAIQGAALLPGADFPGLVAQHDAVRRDCR